MTIDELAKLGVEEQIDALAAIWDRLAEQNALIPLTAEERLLLDQRYANEKDLPGKTWTQVRSEIEANLERP